MYLPHRRGGMFLVALGLICVSATLFGLGALITFDQTAGATRPAPRTWPRASTIRRSPKRAELLVFVHPFCSCTVATLNELTHIEDGKPEGSSASPDTTILFAGESRAEVEGNPLWKRAREFPGAHLIWDRDAREARRFGALTSGYAMLYSPSGGLLFSGGVTGSRGHEGDNYGLERLLSSIQSGKPATAGSRVFGCALFGKEKTL